MSKVFLAYRPLHPPTGIEHCCFARFTDPGATNLITAHINILEVFRLHTLSSGEVVSEVCASFTLAGKVEGLHVINLNRAELPDVLLISFASAKAVLVCYEPEAAELAVLDLYAFDHDAIGVGSGVRADAPDVEKAGGLAEQSPTVMDPSSRCAAMLIYGTQVAMMPLRRDMLWRKVLRVVLSSRADRASKRKGLRLNEKTTVSMAMTARRMGSDGSRKRKREEGREGGLSAEAGPREAMVDLGAQGQVQEARPEEERDEGEGGEEEEGATDDESIYDEEGDQRDDGVFGVGREGSLGGPGVRAVGETMARGRGEQEARADEMEGAEFERELGGEKPFVIKLREELQIRGVVKDMRFLGGFMQPTLAILHEQPPSWAGILAARAHTCHVSVLTCGLSAAGTGQKATVLYQVNLLPHDSFRLSPPPPPLSGFLVVSTNALLYIDEARVRCTMATNGFGPITVPTARYPLQDPFTSGLHDAVSLNGAHVSFLAPRVAVVTAGSGELLVLHLVVQGGRVHALRLVKVGGHGAGVLSSAVEAFWDGEGEQGTGWLVIGSKTVDSVLLRYECVVRERRSEAEGVVQNGIADDKAVVMMDADSNGGEGLMHADAGTDHSSSDVDAHVTLTAMQNGVMDGQHDVDEEVFLYGQTIQESAVGTEANGDDKGDEEQDVEDLVEGLSVTVVDTFPTLGPIMDATLAPRLPRDAYELSGLGGGKGEATDVKVEGFHTRMSDAELVCTAGQGKEGALTVLRRGLIAETLGRAALPMGGGGCRGAWVLPSDAGGDEGEEVLEGFVVVAMDKTTIIVRYQGQTFEAVSNPEDVGFYGQATTLALAPVGGGWGSCRCMVVLPPG